MVGNDPEMAAESEENNKSTPHPEYKAKERLMRIVTDEADVVKCIEALNRYFDVQSQSPRVVLHQLKSPSDSSLLHLAASTKAVNDAILNHIIGLFPQDLVAEFVATQNCRGDTALHVAARVGRVSAVDILINCNSMMLTMKNKLGNTALHEAVIHDQYEVVCCLSKDQEVACLENNQKKSPLYLAVEHNDLAMISILLRGLEPSKLQGMSPAHAAIAYNNLGALRTMSEQSPGLLEMKDAAGGNPLHLAAYWDNIPAIMFLLKHYPKFSCEWDRDGDLPIHVACKMGNVRTIRTLLYEWDDDGDRHIHLLYNWGSFTITRKVLRLRLDPAQLINERGQNILHVSAMFGRHRIVRYICKDSKLEMLINESDNDGNTPLHLATMYSQPLAVLSVVQDPRVKLDLKNNECLTAWDIATQLVLWKNAFRTWLVRASLSVPSTFKIGTSQDESICKPHGRSVKPTIKLSDRENFGKQAKTRLIVATLVLGAAYAAGFAVTVDNGANLVNRRMFRVFEICNTLAMYSSMITVVILLWVLVRSADNQMAVAAHMYSVLPFGITLISMSIAFMAGVSRVVSDFPPLLATVHKMGLVFIIMIGVIYLTLYFPIMASRRRSLNIVFFVILRLFVVLSGSSVPTQYIEDWDKEKRNSASASQPQTESGDESSTCKT